MSKPPLGVILRWLVAIALCTFGLLHLNHVLNIGLERSTLSNTLVGMASLFLALTLVGPELVAWALVPLHAFVDHLMLPGGSEPPPADFKLARYYVTQQRHEEACEEYAKIIRYHPEQTDAYLEGIREAFLAGDPAQAKKFYVRGRRVMRTRTGRRLLRGVYTAKHEEASLPDDELAVEPGMLGVNLPAGESAEHLSPAEDRGEAT